MLNSHLINRNQIDEVKWNQFVNQSPQQSIYCNTWYLDSICNNWMGIVISSKNSWVAIMPLNLSSKFFIDYSIQPLFAKYLGVLFTKFDYTLHKELDMEKKIINKILDVIPATFRIVNYNFSPAFKYFLPFYWRNFNIIPRIAYQLNLEINYSNIVSNYSTSIKNDIKKSTKNNLKCYKSNDINELTCICINNKIIEKKHHSVLIKLWHEIMSRDKGFCLYVKDLEGNLCCGGAFVFDQDKLIIVLLSTIKKYKRHGATSLLLDNAIKIASLRSDCKYFDFKGSMMETIEKYLRGFNPSPTVYFNVRKNKIGWIFKLYQNIKLKSQYSNLFRRL